MAIDPPYYLDPFANIIDVHFGDDPGTGVLGIMIPFQANVLGVGGTGFIGPPQSPILGTCVFMVNNVPLIPGPEFGNFLLTFTGVPAVQNMSYPTPDGGIASISQTASGSTVTTTASTYSDATDYDTVIETDTFTFDASGISLVTGGTETSIPGGQILSIPPGSYPAVYFRVDGPIGFSPVNGSALYGLKVYFQLPVGSGF